MGAQREKSTKTTRTTKNAASRKGVGVSGTGRPTTTVDLDTADIATLLGAVASRLRNDGLALVGMAARSGCVPGSVEHRDLHALAGSMDRAAALVEAVGRGLCRRCRLMGVVEQVVFRSPLKAH